MEELQRIAMAYYNAAPPSIRKAADDFIGEMDHDGDGKVILAEFLDFTKRRGYAYLSNRAFFNQLNLSGTKKLSKQEALTMFYIVGSGRPLCDGCGILITSTFFTCVECFNRGNNNTFDLCPECFISWNHVHQHNEFLDNFLLLKTKRSQQGSMTTGTNTAGPSSSSQAIVIYNQPPETKKNMWRSTAKAALEIGVQMSTIASNLCKIM